MLALIALLPISWQPRAKAIIALGGVILAGVLAFTLLLAPALPPGPARWAFVVIAALTAIGVHQTPAPGYVAPPLGRP